MSELRIKKNDYWGSPHLQAYERIIPATLPNKHTGERSVPHNRYGDRNCGVEFRGRPLRHHVVRVQGHRRRRVGYGATPAGRLETSRGILGRARRWSSHTFQGTEKLLYLLCSPLDALRLPDFPSATQGAHLFHEFLVALQRPELYAELFL